jgi:hypothetical protein
MMLTFSGNKLLTIPYLYNLKFVRFLFLKIFIIKDESSFKIINNPFYLIVSKIFKKFRAKEYVLSRRIKRSYY